MSTFDDTVIPGDDYLEHYGILRRSGRYPWGSGGNEVARSRSLYDYIAEMSAKGLSEAEIAAGLSSEEHPFTSTHLRQAKSLARNTIKRDQIHMAKKLREKGWSHDAIAKRLGLKNESVVRSMLKEGELEKLEILHNTADFLRDRVLKDAVIDIGAGVEHWMNIARSKLDTAIAILKDEGFGVFSVQTDTASGPAGQKTTIKVLAKPGIEYRDVARDPSMIKTIQGWSDDGGKSYSVIKPPLNLSSKRLQVVYGDQGGTEKDGVIYVREGKSDLSLGKSRYAQVRIAVDGTHYIKGMAMYKDDLPPGVDVQFHTNKKSTDVSSKLDALKELKSDPTNPFGSLVRQIKDPNDDTKVTSVMNLVNEQGDWEKWKNTLSSQMLSKQSRKLVKEQLNNALEQRKEQLDEIKSLTNPAVKKKLLEEFADSADSASVQLKAKALPGTANHVILPLNSLKDTEIYAPNYKNGDRVVLIRHPHGGTFEIPELVVNNRHAEAKKLLGQATDAVAINAKVAERLSGADFDGDTVLVIPNNHGLVKTTPALHELKGFDPKHMYAPYDGMKTIDGGTYNATTKKVDYPIDPKTGEPKKPTSYKQRQMGEVSNLITDMTIRGAPPSDIARAVKHSMVVIDSEKHMLDYRQSAIDNGIQQLKEKYQKPYADEVGGGASTLISRAKSTIMVDKTKPRPYGEQGGPIDPATGKKMTVPDTYINKDGILVTKRVKAQRLAVTEDAHELSSGTPIEALYADHSNALKAMANSARKAALETPPAPYNPTANKTYKEEVDHLKALLKVAEANAPKERAAQVLAQAQVAAKKAANPHMDAAEEKKLKGLAIQEARARLNAGKTPIPIEPREWEAIQHGAFRPTTLDAILRNADPEQVKKLATPRVTLMSPAKSARAQGLLAMGRTQAEVAEILGVSLSTLKRELRGE